MYYSENEKLILGINTIWILQPLLNTIIINKYLYIHTILVIVCSLLFWNNIINYYYDLLTAITFVIHILYYGNNSLFHYLLLINTLVLVYYTNEFQKINKYEYAFISHLLFRKMICYLFCIKFNSYTVKQTMFYISFYFIYTFNLLLRKNIYYVYNCIELIIIILLKNELNKLLK